MILAKSDGTSLQEHVDDCLVIADQIERAIPEISSIAGIANYFQILKTAILFHDMGKIHPEFQKLLNKAKNNWEQQRHEIYSLAFTYKLCLEDNQLELIQRAILGHHKTYQELLEKYKNSEQIKNEYLTFWQFENISHHPEDYWQNLKLFNKDLLIEFINFIIRKMQLYGIKIPMKQILYEDIPHPVESMVLGWKNENTNIMANNQELVFWGSLKMCDHYGSAKIKEIPVLANNDFEFIDKISEPYKHQRISWETESNVVLVAPTGAGKTESALGWLRNQHKRQAGKVYYILPYTASINAMHKRLAYSLEGVDNPLKSKKAGIQHGKLQQYVYSLIDEEDIGSNLQDITAIYHKMVHPLKVLTPFQILKYFFGVKGYEIGFVNLCGSYLILDEIHAYDVQTFAQIIIMLEILTKRFNCKVFIMTATLPSFMYKEIEKVIMNLKTIRPETEYLEKIERHKVEIMEGDIFTVIDKTWMDNITDKRTIIVCNTVIRSQKCYKKIKELFPYKKISLLHSRFTGKDRMDREKDALDQSTDILIGTQAIEVSLDIDYDFMITEPAPIDALLQRFGRINRKGMNENPASVIICSEGSKYDKKIYPEIFTRRTLELLGKIDTIKESKLQDYIDKVYPEWLSEHEKEYKEILELFRSSLSALQPYCFNQESEDSFYEIFTGVKVLPAELFRDYTEYLEAGNIIEAESFLISLSQSTYLSLLHHKEGSRVEKVRVVRNRNDKFLIEDVLVAKCKYDSNVGILTMEYCDIELIDNFC
ncbi:MAG: CRISPR-associated helicase Cas3' [Candidatus Cloacimonetes bacterium]|nr:CRISPR-associated helicase Cas3' [Candidatus Cloacimonadota bacterium]